MRFTASARNAETRLVGRGGGRREAGGEKRGGRCRKSASDPQTWRACADPNQMGGVLDPERMFLGGSGTNLRQRTSGNESNMGRATLKYVGEVSTKISPARFVSKGTNLQDEWFPSVLPSKKGCCLENMTFWLPFKTTSPKDRGPRDVPRQQNPRSTIRERKPIDPPISKEPPLIFSGQPIGARSRRMANEWYRYVAWVCPLFAASLFRPVQRATQRKANKFWLVRPMLRPRHLGLALLVSLANALRLKRNQKVSTAAHWAQSHFPVLTHKPKGVPHFVRHPMLGLGTKGSSA